MLENKYLRYTWTWRDSCNRNTSFNSLENGQLVGSSIPHLISFWIWTYLDLSSPKTAGGQILLIKYFMLLIFVTGRTLGTEIWLTFLFFENIWWGDLIAWYCRGECNKWLSGCCHKSNKIQFHIWNGNEGGQDGAGMKRDKNIVIGLFWLVY